MNALGIYFGPRAISIAETKGAKVIKNIKLPWSVALGTESLEEKVPEEVKLVALIKDELIKNKIDAKEVTVSLSGKDLIIRTFEMPVLPAKEMPDAINFESKKYIPFRLEELISASQWRTDKAIAKNRVLYVGIRKEILDKYISVISQLGLAIKGIEYSAFSVLRMLNLANIKEKGIIGVFNADLKEEDEVNFIVLENAFPLFSRDIILTGMRPEAQKPEEGPAGAVFDKLKREIRISLDYYHRKFPAQKIEKAFFISARDYRLDLETFIKEIGLSIQFVEITKYTGAQAFSLSFIKGYAASISGFTRTGITIDLFAAKAKIAPVRAAQLKPQGFRLPAGLSMEPKIAIAALLICLFVFILGLFKINNAKKSLKAIAEASPQILAVNLQSSYEELGAINSRYKEKLNALNNLKEQLYLTALLDALPRLIPENIWLVNLSFQARQDNERKFIMQGIADLGDSNKEVELINSFRSRLVGSSLFAKYFKEISIVSMERSQSMQQKNIATHFSIACKNE